MRRKLPTTQSLQAFERAARHESFTRAAEDLALTQSAVCRQIAALEEFLGVSLFRRIRRGVRLTEAGQAYSRKIASRLDALERDTLAAMAHQGAAASLELAVVPTFATRWLLPRLAGFRERHPDIQVHLTTSTRPFLFEETEFDAAIYFGEAGWPGTEAQLLMGEDAVPVCSPGLVPSPPLAPGDIARMPLLQQTTRPYAWRRWFESCGLAVEGDLGGMRLELFSMLAQAAIEGFGVALIPPFLIREELASRRLVIAHPQALPTDRAYYLIVPERKTGSLRLEAFRIWLLAECARFGDGT
ncbi:MAG: transcriptional regulator GcvA [Rhodocyclaceae bacterium]|nr:transcriptional regulator GcvA [Rhodocyclaceae bacterium]